MYLLVCFSRYTWEFYSTWNTLNHLKKQVYIVMYKTNRNLLLSMGWSQAILPYLVVSNDKYFLIMLNFSDGGAIAGIYYWGRKICVVQWQSCDGRYTYRLVTAQFLYQVPVSTMAITTVQMLWEVSLGRTVNWLCDKACNKWNPPQRGLTLGIMET